MIKITDVPPSYKNVGLESFGEQRYVHSELLQQYMANEEYLLQLCRKIEYLTPPAVRKHFILQDSFYDLESYGCTVNGEQINFCDDTEKRIFVDFTNNDLIDYIKTDALIDSHVQTDAENNKKVVKQATVRLGETTEYDYKTRNYSPWTIRDKDGNIISDDMTCNEFWYIGYDRNRHYETRPNWLANMLNGEIPGISRAQTFKATSNGLLEGVSLNLRGGTNTGMPLIVQIRRTEEKDGVLVPVDSDKKHLAYTEVKFTNTDPGVMTVTFPQPPMLTKNETYAIVLLSPLSHHTNCYSIGGWNKHCHADVYEDGNAFYSFNSGYTWIRYGKDDEEVDYHAGKYAPQDFAFQCHIKKITSNYIQNKDYYVYLKPILSGPVNSIELNTNDNIVDNHNTIEYQVSNDAVNWTTVGDSHVVDFENPRETTFIRARLRTSNNTTPKINDILVILHTQAASNMYARTRTYYPKDKGILSADVWGRVYAPFEMDPTVTCTAEIISEKIVSETFMIIEPDDLLDYLWIKDLEKYADDIRKSRDLTQYLTDNPSVVTILGNHQVYVKGFITSLKFVNSPAYPIRDCVLQPVATGVMNVNYGEWYDYTIDYEEDTLTFREEELTDIPRGALTVKYNPLFISGLTPKEIGESITSKTTTDGDINDEGLIIDYFKETLTVTDENVETRRLPLRTSPIDPIRHLYYNGDELKQDQDYSIDFNSKEIVFPVINTDDESSRLNVNDTVEIIYTPNIDDNGISLGWYAERTNLLKQVRILPYYIEYKA